MNDKQLEVWGCIVCSNLWSASATNSTVLKFSAAAVWLLFVFFLLWQSRAARKEAL